MKKIIMLSILILSLSCVAVSSNAYVINGNIWYNSSYAISVSSLLGGLTNEAVYCLKIQIKENCSIHSVSAYMMHYNYLSSNAYAMGVIYWDNLSLADNTESKKIMSAKTYVFNFSHEVDVSEDSWIYVGIYGDAPTRSGQGIQVYNIISDTTNNYYDIQNNYPNPDSTFTSTSSTTGYIPSIYVNYTTIGDSTDITFYNNTVNTSGKYEYKYSSSNGYKIWLNFTGLTTPFHKYENIINATGNHNYKLNSTGYYVWANYTGNTTPITLFENIINATGYHNYTLNSSGYFVYANYTGNATSFNLSQYHIFLNLSGIVGFINWTGSLNSTDMNVSFNVTGNMSITANANVNDTGVWIYLGAMLTLDNAQFFLFILIGLWTYFIYLFYKEKEVIFSFCIIGMGIPLGIILSGVAYYNSFPFGYLITFMVILISFLIPSYGIHQKNKLNKR